MIPLGIRIFCRLGGSRMKVPKAKRATKTLSERSRERQRNDFADLLFQAVDHSSDLITMADLDGNIMFVNRAFLRNFRYSEHEIIGQSVRRLTPANVPDSISQEMGMKAREDGGWKGECIAVRQDGTEFPVLLSLGPIKDRSGKLMGTFSIAQDISSQKETEEHLRRSEGRMRAMLEDSAKLTELVDIFQSCQSMEEAYKITEDALRNMLAARSGALCITSPSRNIVESVATWGDSLSTDKTFSPDDCWALRRGRIHAVRDSGSPLRCGHVKEDVQKGHLCVPLAAQGETLGVLYLEGLGETSASDSIERVTQQATAVGERISLAIANLKLRGELRTQSIRDPLTGLFNRRYMEETLEREISRAVRNEQVVSILMCDIDHFKRFNDTYGHQAGDVLLRALGDFLLQRTRGQDVPCRFGGEEFAVILAGANLDAARQRGEILREESKALTVHHGGQLLGRISLSVGVAAFPEHGKSAEELVKAADSALYRAKSEGRDRVVLMEV
jgi:diguanylate cyclase (GGDEF)-like protein/PAS domain S-box-containing protein